MTYDPRRQVLVLVGGIGQPDAGLQVWQYGGWVEEFGVGCPGHAGIPTWHCHAPEPGTSWRATLEQLDTTSAGAAAILAFTIVPPIDLSAFGLWGCSLYTTLDRFLPLPVHSGSAALTLPIPADPSLRGAEFYLTGVSLEPVNPFGAVVSAPVRLQFAR